MKMPVPIVQSAIRTGTRYAINILPEWCRTVSSVVLRNGGKGALLLSIVFLVGCEEDLASQADTSKPFTLYGVMSPDLDTQAVRIYPVEGVPTLGSPEQLGADVYSINLETGEREIWKDSVLLEPNGQFAHVFWAPFRPEFGRTYRVEAVRRSDGAMSFAEVRIPPPATVRIDESDAPHLHVIVEGEQIRASQPIAEYVIGAGEPWRRYEVSYVGTEDEIAGGWTVTFNMIVDYDLIRFHIRSGDGYCFDYVPLYGLTLHMLVGDAVWNPPGGLFEPNVLSVGRTMNNVENGYGFIGGGYALEKSLRLSQEAVELACFTYEFPEDDDGT